MALDCFRAKYHGKPAHAAGEPWNGINAVNGVQLAIHAMDMMRQQVRPETRIGTWIIAGEMCIRDSLYIASWQGCQGRPQS